MFHYYNYDCDVGWLVVCIEGWCPEKKVIHKIRIKSTLSARNTWWVHNNKTNIMKFFWITLFLEILRLLLPPPYLLFILSFINPPPPNILRQNPIYSFPTPNLSAVSTLLIRNLRLIVCGACPPCLLLLPSLAAKRGSTLGDKRGGEKDVNVDKCILLSVHMKR